MKEKTVRISFDIPPLTHHLLKIACAEAEISIKDFMLGVMMKGIKDLKEGKKRGLFKK